MKIETNINRDKKLHDNVNFLPIEKQIFDELKLDPFFGKVEFVVYPYSSSTTGYFICDDEYTLELRISNLPKEFYLKYNPQFNNHDDYSLNFTYPFNKDISFDDMKLGISELNKKIQLLKEINKWADDKHEILVDKFNSYVGQYFINIPEISYSFTSFAHNITCRNKDLHLDLKYDNNHSSLTIVNGLLVNINEEVVKLFSTRENDYKLTLSKSREIVAVSDKLIPALGKLNFYEIPEFIEWENKKKNAVEILKTLGRQKYDDRFLD